MEFHRSMGPGIGILLYFHLFGPPPQRYHASNFQNPCVRAHSRENAMDFNPLSSRGGQSSVKVVKQAELVASHCLSRCLSDFMLCSLC